MSPAFKDIEKLTASDPRVMKELLTVFIRENHIHIKKIEAARQSENWKELKKIAHKVKSSFALVGMMEHRALAEKLEEVAGDEPATTKKLTLKLLKACKEAISLVEKRLVELA